MSVLFDLVQLSELFSNGHFSTLYLYVSEQEVALEVLFARKTGLQVSYSRVWQLLSQYANSHWNIAHKTFQNVVIHWKRIFKEPT